MNKEIKFSEEAKSLIKEGIDEVIDAVKVTLGPKGRNVIIRKDDNKLHITKDGITVIKEIDYDNPYKSIGATLIRDISNSSNEESGDGSTTSAILGGSIITEGLKRINNGINPVDLKNGIEKAKNHIIEELDKMAIPVDDESKLNQVATISSNGDEFIGNLVADSIKKVGADGVVKVIDSDNFKTELEITEGFKVDTGYMDSVFINNNAKMNVELINPYILLYSKPIMNISKLANILNYVSETNGSLLIIADEYEGDTIQFLKHNKKNNGLKVCPVKAQWVDSKLLENLEDLGILTGGTVFPELSWNMDITSDDFDIDFLGRAKRVTVTKESTVIIGGEGDSAEIDERKALLKQQKDNAPKETLEYSHYYGRFVRMSNIACVLKVAGETEVEISEKKDRIEDAINATKAALEEGIIPGGGVALLRISETFDNIKYDNDDEFIGISIMREAIKAPIFNILNNAGESEKYIIEKILDKKSFKYGYNVRTGKYEDLIKSGVIDPKKVTRTAISNAASIAGLFLTTDCVIVNKK